MVTVDHDGGLWETNLGNLTKMRIHVDDNVLNLFSVLKTAEIADHVCLFAVRKNIYDLSVPGIGKNCLVLFSTGVALKFVDGQHFRKLPARVIDQVEIAESCRCRDIMLFGYVRGRDGISKIFNDAGVLPARHAVVAREKAVLLIKPFPAVSAYIPPLAQVRIYVLAKSGYIFDLLHAVVMNPIRLFTAAGAGMAAAGQFNLYMA